MKADLHAHGPIRFHQYFLKSQGYKGNILQLMAETCFKREIAICAVISEESDERKEGYKKRHGIKLIAKGLLKKRIDLSEVIKDDSQIKKISRDSVHNRFGFLLKEMKKIPKEYTVEAIGKNIIRVEKGKKEVFFVNGQTVHSIDEKRAVESLVIGTNEIENSLKIEDFLKKVKEKGYLVIAEHPACESHHGIGEKSLIKYKDYFDAIEGHNSQLMIPAFFFPWVEFLDSFKKGKNEESKKIADSLKKPWVATSDCHRIEDIGVSYIEFNSKINTSNEKDFLKDLKKIVRSNNFNKKCSYQPMLGGLSWSSKLLWGGWNKEIMKILVFGNSLVEKDNIALKVLPRLRKEFPEIEFKEFDPTEALEKEIEGEKLKILDVAENIKEVSLIRNLDKIKTDKIYSMHDFDLGLNLKILMKIGKLKEVEIIAIPWNFSEEKAIEGVKKILI